MDHKTYLKELAKHVQRNTNNPTRVDSSPRKVQVKTFKTEVEQERLLNLIDVKSLELYAEMMRDRYGNRREQED